MMDREHANQIVFDGQEGLDPLVDLSLRGAQIRALIQGRASTWHRHLLLTPITAPAGEAVSPCRSEPGHSMSRCTFPDMIRQNYKQIVKVGGLWSGVGTEIIRIGHQIYVSLWTHAARVAVTSQAQSNSARLNLLGLLCLNHDCLSN